MNKNGYLIFDIETIPNQSIEPPSFDESSVKLGNLKNPLKIAEKITEEYKQWTQGLTKKMSIEGELCQICCLGAIAVDQSGTRKEWSRSIYGKTGDDEIVAVFLEWFSEGRTLVSWNGKNFDLPILWKRSIAHNIRFTNAIRLASLCSPYRHDLGHIDVMWLYANGGMCKLVEACKFLHIDAKNGMDGSMIYDAWKNDDEERIKEYNMQDCEATLEVAQTIGAIGQDVI